MLTVYIHNQVSTRNVDRMHIITIHIHIYITFAYIYIYIYLLHLHISTSHVISAQRFREKTMKTHLIASSNICQANQQVTTRSVELNQPKHIHIDQVNNLL